MQLVKSCEGGGIVLAKLDVTTVIYTIQALVELGILAVQEFTHGL